MKGNAEVAVCLLPARTDTRWFHLYVYPFAKLRFIMGRIRFIDEQGRQQAGSLFPSMVAIYKGASE
jgi:hypothetical protein